MTSRVSAWFFPIRKLTDATLEKEGIAVARRPLFRPTRPMIFIPYIEDDRLYERDLDPNIGPTHEIKPEPESRPEPQPAPLFFPSLTKH
jgi:hypothetical protein